jgi:hypothetical protein
LAVSSRCALIGLLLTATAAALVYQAWRLGLTSDEPSHFAAAYQYWLGNDVLRPSDTPPLTRMICGWVPRLLAAPVRRDTDGWRRRDAYQIGAETFSALDAAHARRLLFLTRLPFLLFPLGVVFLVWHWGRALFGPRVSLMLAASAALEPTILGHGALIKSDVAAAFGALLFAWCAWRYWQAPALRRLPAVLLALVVGVLAKFTLLPLVAFALILVLAKGPRWAALLVPLTVYFAILAAYQFRAAPVESEDLRDLVYAGVPERVLPLASAVARIPWPRQFVRGLLFIGGSMHHAGFPGYMLGRKITGAEPLYFPLAWAVKFPIPLQILTLAGRAALAVRLGRRQFRSADLFLWGSAAWFFLTAMLSNYHIGIRHVMPALPFFILGGGLALERWAAGRTGRWLAPLLFLWLAISSLRVYPQGISYFNEWIGGSENGWKYLADSNLDWGQNLPELADYVREHRIERIKLYTFGLDDPGHYLAPGKWFPQPWPGPPLIQPGSRLDPAPGIYAVSFNELAGFLAPDGYQDYLACFRTLRPKGRAGYSIFIYEVE